MHVQASANRQTWTWRHQWRHQWRHIFRLWSQPLQPRRHQSTFTTAGCTGTCWASPAAWRHAPRPRRRLTPSQPSTPPSPTRLTADMRTRKKIILDTLTSWTADRRRSSVIIRISVDDKLITNTRFILIHHIDRPNKHRKTLTKNLTKKINLTNGQCITGGFKFYFMIFSWLYHLVTLHETFADNILTADISFVQNNFVKNLFTCSKIKRL